MDIFLKKFGYIRDIFRSPVLFTTNKRFTKASQRVCVVGGKHTGQQ